MKTNRSNPRKPKPIHFDADAAKLAQRILRWLESGRMEITGSHDRTTALKALANA